MSLRYVLALPRKVLQREKGRMEIIERTSERSWIWKWACEKGDGRKRVGEKGGKNTSISRLSRCSFFGIVSSGKSSLELSTIANSNCKCLTSRTTTWKRGRRGRELVCVAYFFRVSANRRTIPKSPGSRSRTTSYDDLYCHLKMIRMTRRVLTSPPLDFSFNVTMINVYRTSIFDKITRWNKREKRLEERKVTESFWLRVETVLIHKNLILIYRQLFSDLLLIGARSVRKQKWNINIVYFLLVFLLKQSLYKLKIVSVNKTYDLLNNPSFLF